jgi:hypothetical protein
VVENNSKKHLGGCRGEGARASVKCPIGPSVQSDRLNEYTAPILPHQILAVWRWLAISDVSFSQ